MPPPTSDWTGHTLSLGRYSIVAKLGEGGMGYVFRAIDRNLDAEVVVKTPRRAMLEDPSFAPRFAQEIRSLVKLAHPYVVRITDVGEHDGVPFAVMQYLSGGSLEDDLPAVGVENATQANLAALSSWLPGIASALDFVHRSGYLHRDVKPGNILFDSHGHPFLSDFGVAKVLSGDHDGSRDRSGVTGQGMLLGTPEYMAPELVMGERVDGRADQYALAVTVYELLCGRRPFEAPTPTAVYVLQTRHTPTPLHKVDSRVPRAVSTIVARALSKTPSDRFASCTEFAEAVIGSLRNAVKAGEDAGSGRFTRQEYIRLRCPSCDKRLKFPRSLFSGSKPAREKRSNCPKCGTKIRITSDAALAEVAEPLAGEIPASTAPRSGSQRVATMVSPAPKAKGPSSVRRAAKTVAEVVDLARLRETPTHGKTLAAVVAILILALAGIAGFGRWGDVASPRESQVSFDVNGLPKDVDLRLDGHRIELAELLSPRNVAPGEHVIVANHPDYEPARVPFSVEPGSRRLVPVRLDNRRQAQVPTPPKDTPASEKRPDVKPDPSPPVIETPPQPSAPVRSNDPATASRSGPKDRIEVRFDPVPPGPETTEKDLEKLLSEPEQFANRIVVPQGFFVVGNEAAENADGTATISVARVGLAVKDLDLCVLQRSTDPPVQVAIDRALVGNLRAIRDDRSRSRSRSAPPGEFGTSPAVLTYHVRRRVDGGKNTWVPVLQQVEFLDGLNFFRIGEGKYHESFRTLRISSVEPGILGLSQRRDWESRLGRPYIATLRKIVRKIKDDKFASEMIQMNDVMSNMLGNVLRQDAEITRQRLQDALRTPTPR